MILLSDETDLSLDDAWGVVAGNAGVALASEAAQRLDAAYSEFSSRADDTPIYGLNTGLGPMVTVAVPKAQLALQQLNLIRSHAAGMGTPLPAREARAVLFARAASLSRNRSAVRAALPQRICDWLDARLAPVIPRHGGVGASGDLVQLAHLGLGLIGEGKILSGDEELDADAALNSAGIAPYDLHFRDGLAIINGVSAMTGVGLAALMDGRAVLDRALTLTALVAEITGLGEEPYSAGLADAKRHPGHHAVATKLRDRLAGSRALDRKTGRPLQEHYSIRCAPQVFGALHDAIDTVGRVIHAELNSASDNPVFDPRSSSILHGGNFHGEPVAMAMDQLKSAMVKATMVSERQLNFLLNDDVNKILPAFLNTGIPGVSFGLQGAQFTAVSTTASSQTIGYPMALHSISSNKDNQDVVSMGFDAACFARDAVSNALNVQAILTLAVQAAVKALGIEGTLAPKTRAFLNQFPAETVSEGHTASLSQVLEAQRRVLESLPAERWD